jgi:hypothetical protein
MLFFDSLDATTEECLLVDLVPSLDKLSLGREASHLGIEEGIASLSCGPQFVLKDLH